MLVSFFAVDLYWRPINLLI